MSERQHHCPFLNRSDVRCSSYFSLDRLQHAFEHCFDDYRACPRYAELLKERQERRTAAGSVAAFAVVGGAEAEELLRGRRDAVSTRFVQITLPDRYPQRLAAAQGVPVAPGL